ncbi:MAG TPA: DUF4242 domain-containing protein [Gemmatimonadales bacterium]|jgi:hypothetical protein
MPRFVVERELPGAGKLSPAELKKISQKCCQVLESMGPRIRWLHSYVTGEKLYCVYEAQSEALIRRHAALGGIPANRISTVTTILDPLAAWSEGQGAA